MSKFLYILSEIGWKIIGIFLYAGILIIILIPFALISLVIYGICHFVVKFW